MKYIKLLQESRYNPVVLLLALAIDAFKLLTKTPQWFIEAFIIILFIFMAVMGLIGLFLG